MSCEYDFCEKNGRQSLGMILSANTCVSLVGAVIFAKTQAEERKKMTAFSAELDKGVFGEASKMTFGPLLPFEAGFFFIYEGF